MDLGSRIREYRKYLDQKQESFANAIGTSKSHVSDIERGAKNPSCELLAKIISTFAIDARFFFGQVADPKEADMSLRGDTSNLGQIERLTKEVQEMKKQYVPKTDDPVIDKVRVYAPLRELVEVVYNWEGSMLRRFTDMAHAYLSGARNESEKTFQKKRDAG